MIKLPNIPNDYLSNPKKFGEWFSKDKSRIINLINSLYYRIYIKTDSHIINLPVNPEKIKYSNEIRTDEYYSFTKGHIVRNIGLKLQTVSFEGVFIKDFTEPLNNVGLVLPPQFYTSYIENLMKTQKSFQFMGNSVDLILGFIQKDSFQAVIKQFDYEERGGEPGDIYYSLVIQEYKPLQMSFRDEGSGVKDIIPVSIPSLSGANDVGQGSDDDLLKPVKKVKEKVLGEIGKEKSFSTGEIISISDIDFNNSEFYSLKDASGNQATVINYKEKRFSDVIKLGMYSDKKIQNGEFESTTTIDSGKITIGPPAASFSPGTNSDVYVVFGPGNLVWISAKSSYTYKEHFEGEKNEDGTITWFDYNESEHNGIKPTLVN